MATELNSFIGDMKNELKDDTILIPLDEERSEDAVKSLYRDARDGHYTPNFARIAALAFVAYSRSLKLEDTKEQSTVEAAMEEVED